MNQEWLTDEEAFAIRKSYFDRQMAIMDYNSGLGSEEKRGLEKGENRMTQLVSSLHAAGRDAEIFQAASDKALREKLFREFHL